MYTEKHKMPRGDLYDAPVPGLVNKKLRVLSAHTQDSERELLLKIAKGDEYSFRVLYDRFRNQVFCLGLKFLKSGTAAEDVLQEVYTKIWVNREKLDGVENFSKYINTLSHNHIYNLLRRKAYEEGFIHDELQRQETQNQDGIAIADFHELQHLLKEAVHQLPTQQKKVFVLSHLEGLKHKEIAQQLNISKETVKKHVMGAIRNIKSFLASKGPISIDLLIFLYILE